MGLRPPSRRQGRHRRRPLPAGLCVRRGPVPVPRPGRSPVRHTAGPGVRRGLARRFDRISPRRVHDAHRFPPRPEIGALDALRASVPAAITWLTGRPERARRFAGHGRAALALADLAEQGLTGGPREELMWFAVASAPGAWRRRDLPGQDGLGDAAVIAGAQARLVGGLQYPLVTGDNATIAEMLRVDYHQLGQALSA